MKLVLLVLFASIAVPFAASGQGSQDDWDVLPVDYGFTTWDADVVAYRGAGGDVEIPAYYEWFTGSTYTVVSVIKLSGWTMPEEAGIFGYLPVTSVVIPETVRTIGANAFAESRLLTNATITVGYSLEIGEAAFRDCTALTNVLFNHLGGSFDYHGERGEIAVGERAFAGCTSLTGIPDGVTHIANEAFLDCTAIIHDIDGAGITGFVGGVTIPTSVVSIQGNPFIGCWGVTSFEVDTLNTNYTSLNGVLFNKAITKLVAFPAGASGAYTIPSTVTNIPSSAFRGYRGLTSITIPSKVEAIDSETFRDCTGLTNVTLEEGVQEIGAYAFYGCEFLRSVTFPRSLINIGDSAFQGCSSLTNLTIPNSVTNIENNAFKYCAALTNVTIPNSVLRIGNAAFEGCSSLTNVTIPDSVTSIGDNAFRGNPKITRVTIGNAVTNIGNDALNGCRSLKEVIIPSSVTTIGRAVFADCTNLQSVLFRGNAPIVRGTGQFSSAPATVYYLEGTQGWSETFAGVPAKVFKPTALPSSVVSNDFHFRWTNTGAIPMNVQRATSLTAPWTVVSSNNATGEFVDASPPSGQAFYRAVLP